MQKIIFLVFVILFNTFHKIITWPDSKYNNKQARTFNKWPSGLFSIQQMWVASSQYTLSIIGNMLNAKDVKASSIWYNYSFLSLLANSPLYPYIHTLKIFYLQASRQNGEFNFFDSNLTKNWFRFGISKN